jgi:TetR/AcrR family transcriptional repressor of mexJK operon
MGRRPKVDRERVLGAARQAFAERGFEATTLAAIAVRLDVSPAALLRHAATKEELFAACMAPGSSDQPLPIDFLAELDAGEDPRQILRRVAHAFVPFLERKFDEQVARFMRAKSGDPSGDPLALLPFAGQPRPTPPQRVFAALEEYFRRAAAAGMLRVADPTAAALAFLGSLHSFVVLRRMVQVPDPPLPLERYVETVIEIWTRGAVSRAHRGRAKGEAE